MILNERRRTRFTVQRSTVLYAKAGKEVIATQIFNKMGVAGSYYGLLEYVNLEQKLCSGKQYRERTKGPSR